MATRAAMEIAGGVTSVEPEALLAGIDPRNINIGIENPYYDEGYSDQETYNRKALPWEGAAYVVAGGSITKIGGRPDALEGPELERQYPNLAEVWNRFARAQDDRQSNPGSINALIADQRRVADQIGNVGQLDPELAEGQSLRAEKIAAKSN